MPGSLSSVPRRTLLTFGSSGLRDQSAPPHAEQKSFANPSGGSKERTSSSPTVTRSEPGTTRPEIAAAVPVRRWHRVQRQYPASMSGSVISNRTPPLYIVEDANERRTLGREVLGFLGIPLGTVRPEVTAIKHERFRHVQVGEDFPITVGAVLEKGAAIARVELVYRTFGKKTWKTLTLSSVGDGLYGGAVPGAEVHNNGLEYYARAITATGKTVQTANGAALPNVATAPYGAPAPGPYGSCGG